MKHAFHLHLHNSLLDLSHSRGYETIISGKSTTSEGGDVHFVLTMSVTVRSVQTASMHDRSSYVLL